MTMTSSDLNYFASRPKRSDIKLLILIPCRGDPKIGLVKWLWQAIPQAPFFAEWDTIEGRPEDDARNAAVQRFLAGDWTHLMMIDDDITPPAHALSMVSHDKPIVSATVFTWKDRQPLALIMKWDEEKQGFKQDTEAIARINSGERLIKVDASGTGCFVVKRQVYENLVSNWFRFQYNDQGRLTMGEDFSFYRRLSEIGYSVYVDGKVVCGHIGQVDIKEIQDFLAGRNENENH